MSVLAWGDLILLRASSLFINAMEFNETSEST